jgi:ubiquinone/menaquinone biosynthesis C-methylase UbiE
MHPCKSSRLCGDTTFQYHAAMIPRTPEPELMDLCDEAAAYAKADFRQVNEAFVDRLLELAEGYERAQAADIGCGPADIPILVATRRADWHIAAIDASPAMLEIASEKVLEAKLVGRVESLLADAKRIPLPDERLDVIFSNSILHHISKTESLWCEVARLCRKGGMIFFRDLCRPESEAQARQIVQQYAGTESQLLQEEYYRSLLSAYTVPEVQKQLAAAGLAGLQVKQVTDRHVDIWGRRQ